MAHMDMDYEHKQEKASTSERIRNFKSRGLSERDATIKGLVSMKRAKKDSGDIKPPAVSSEPYPYGLRLRLESEDLKKLGMGSLPDVGKTMKVTAEATVQSVSSNQSTDDKQSRKSVELQITSMKLA